MEDLIKLLREQTILCRRLKELFENLVADLEKNSLDVVESVQKVEKIILELNKNSSETQKFLQSSKYNTLADFLNAQEKNIQRDVAERLLAQSKNLQDQLKRQIDKAGKLTESGESFINFNLNLMSRTQADTYGADRLAEGQSSRRIVEFKC